MLLKRNLNLSPSKMQSKFADKLCENHVRSRQGASIALGNRLVRSAPMPPPPLPPLPFPIYLS